MQRAPDNAEFYAIQPVEMHSTSEERLPGIPIIHRLTSDGTVKIPSGDDGLRRVVIQPAGLIMFEIASPEMAGKFVEMFNAQCVSNSRYAEAIDYREVLQRAPAAGF